MKRDLQILKYPCHQMQKILFYFSLLIELQDLHNHRPVGTCRAHYSSIAVIDQLNLEKSENIARWHAGSWSLLKNYLEVHKISIRSTPESSGVPIA